MDRIRKKGRYKNPILNELDGLSSDEQIRVIKTYRDGLGFYDVSDIFDKPYEASGPYGNTQSQYIDSRWFHIMPNYEYCSKEQPIIPLFASDTERTIYILIMTNSPLKGDVLDVELYKSRGGKFTSITLFSKDDPQHSLTLMREGYVNPRLLQDMMSYKIKVIQMSEVSDFFSIFKNGFQIAYSPMRYQIGIDYDIELNKSGIKGFEPDSWQSGRFMNMLELDLRCGYKNYPMFQFLDPDKWGLHAIKNNLDIIISGDSSRIHQLPLPFNKINVSNTSIWKIDKEYKELTKYTIKDLLISKFWPKGLTKKYPPECFRAPEMATSYPGLSIFNCIRK